MTVEELLEQAPLGALLCVHSNGRIYRKVWCQLDGYRKPGIAFLDVQTWEVVVPGPLMAYYSSCYHDRSGLSVVEESK